MTINRHIDLSGLPKHLHSRLQSVNGAPVLLLDNRSEFHSKDSESWALLHGVVIHFAPPHRPSAK